MLRTRKPLCLLLTIVMLMSVFAGMPLVGNAEEVKTQATPSYEDFYDFEDSSQETVLVEDYGTGVRELATAPTKENVNNQAFHIVKNASSQCITKKVIKDYNTGNGQFFTVSFDAKMNCKIGDGYDTWKLTIRMTDSSDGWTESPELVVMHANEPEGPIDLYVDGSSVGQIASDSWHHFDVSFNKSTGKYYVYLDSAEVVANKDIPITNPDTAVYEGFSIANGDGRADNSEFFMDNLGLYFGKPEGGATSAPGTPTATPAPKAILTMNSMPYKDNGCDAENTTFSNGTLNMNKTKTGAYGVLVWADALSDLDATLENTYTLSFDAKVSDGYNGSSWDGYAISLRNHDVETFEIIRLYPLDDTTTGITFGAGGEMASSVSNEKHHYDIVFNKNSVIVYCDGTKAAEKTSLGYQGDLHAFQIQSGHNEATECKLEIGDFAVYAGGIIPSGETQKPGSNTPAPTPIIEMNSKPYADNGCDAENTSFSNGTLSMNKTKTGAYNMLVWADKLSNLDEGLEGTYTLSFEADVSDGYNGSWDGYSVALRNHDVQTFEIIRLFPVDSGTTGITIGAGNTAMDMVSNGNHQYDVVFNKNIAVIYCDGVKVGETTSLGYSGSLHAFQIQSGHSDATECKLVMKGFAVYPGNAHENDPIATAKPTKKPNVTTAPTATPAPTLEPDKSVLVNGAVVTINGKQVSKLTGNRTAEVKATVTGKSEEDVSGVFAIMLYNSSDQIENISYVKTLLANNQTETLTAGFNLPSNVNGYYIKAVVVENLSSMKALSNTVTVCK